jgi:Integrase core domain
MKLSQETQRMLKERKIVEGLLSGKSKREIIRELKVGEKRVNSVEKLAKKSGYIGGDIPLPPYPEKLFERDKGLLQEVSEPELRLLPHKEWILEKLKAGWHKVTVFEELPIKVGRSSFYRFLHRHDLDKIRGCNDRVVPEIVHRPGEALLLDWGHLCTLKDPTNRKGRKVWVLVGIMGYSRYMAARIVWSNSVAETIEAMKDILAEIGGVPQRVTSDNPKCFALEASKYEALLNPALELFAHHYGFVLECLPPADPEKKGKVERPMPFVRRLFEAHGEWKGIEEAQNYLSQKIAIANERKHGTTHEKPILRFLEGEAAALKTLPSLPFERSEVAEPIVRRDGHVRFQGKYYSVGEGLSGKTVLVLGNERVIRIYLAGKLLEVHERLWDPLLSKSTKKHHLKPWEQTISDNSIYLKKGALIGPNCRVLIGHIVHREGGFIDTRMIWGIFELASTYEIADIEAACKMAVETHSCSYRAIKGYLGRTAKPKKKVITQYQFTRDLSVYAQALQREENTNDSSRHTTATSSASAFNGRSGATSASYGTEEECEY